MPKHSTLVAGVDIHTAFRAIYSDATARTTESGYVSTDVNKIALQQSDNTLWLCTAVTSGVPTWAALGAAGAGDLVAANNLSDLASESTARTNLGLGTAATHAATDFALVSNNLSDLANAGTARTNLGLGTAATHAATDFDTAGSASTAQSTAETFATSAITALSLGTASTHASTDFILSSARGANSGVAELDSGGLVPSAELPIASTTVSGALKVDGTTITMSGGVASASGGSSISTSTVTVTTSSIADSAADNTQILDTGHAGLIGSITVDNSAYVRIYCTAADATADTRTVIPSDGGYVAPGSGASTVPGLLFEYWFAPGSLTPNIRPFTYYSSDGSGLPCKITNTSGGTTTITLTTKLQQVVS